ncbi:MAG: hypothetical protein JO003_03895, partial [Candidatus Eremiobacteraeota bacterium]|nr:hypothetical protein [Candidatus Eremiobacteraeota bacterium]
MRHLCLVAVALLAFATTSAASAQTWIPVTAAKVNAGVNSKSTFVIQAWVALPLACYATRARVYHATSELNRSFIFEEKEPDSACGGSIVTCTISRTFALPIQHTIQVHTA